jgi:hypothetical protein
MTGRVALWDGHLLARHVMSSSYTLYYTIGMKWLGDAQEGTESVLWLTRLLGCGCDVVIYAFHPAAAVIRSWRGTELVREICAYALSTPNTTGKHEHGAGPGFLNTCHPCSCHVVTSDIPFTRQTYLIALRRTWKSPQCSALYVLPSSPQYHKLSVARYIPEANASTVVGRVTTMHSIS